MPLFSIELRHLRYFLAAAERGSFRKAAAALAVEESAISRRVRDLEDRLGASLFQRHHSGVVLTVAGQQFLDQVRAAVSHLGYGAKNVALAGRSEVGHIRVGILSSLSSGFLADLFLAFGSDQSAISIDFTDGSTIEHVAAIRAHHIDIAFVTGEGRPPECEAVYLWSEPVFALLQATHPLSSKPLLMWEDLINETIIVSEQIPGHESHASVLQNICDLGCRPKVHWQNVGRDNLASLVAIGHGITLMSEASTSNCLQGLVYRQISGEMLPFSAVWSAKNDNPAMRRLLSMARARGAIASQVALPVKPPKSP